jgi:hypothetical protein
VSRRSTKRSTQRCGKPVSGFGAHPDAAPRRSGDHPLK